MIDEEIISQTFDKQLNVACDATDATKFVLDDASVIKALECCFSDNFSKCEECPLKSKLDEIFSCMPIKQKLVLALINRQKAEIERLKKAGEEAVSCFTRMESLYKIKCKELDVAKAETIKELVKRQKEKSFPLACGLVVVDVDDIEIIAEKWEQEVFDSLVKEMENNNG